MWWGDLRCVEGRGGGDDGLTLKVVVIVEFEV